MTTVASSLVARSGVDDVGQRVRGLDDHFELALKSAGAFLQLVFVLKARIEAFELGPVPQHVGLLLNRDAAGDTVLGEQRLTDEPSMARRLNGGRAAFAASFTAKGSMTSNTRVDLALVAPSATDLASASATTRKRSGDRFLMLDRPAG